MKNKQTFNIKGTNKYLKYNTRALISQILADLIVIAGISHDPIKNNINKIEEMILMTKYQKKNIDRALTQTNKRLILGFYRSKLEMLHILLKKIVQIAYKNELSSYKDIKKIILESEIYSYITNDTGITSIDI